MQVLHPDLLNENFVRAEYAVRGELYLKGAELQKQGREVIFTNGATRNEACGLPISSQILKLPPCCVQLATPTSLARSLSHSTVRCECILCRNDHWPSTFTDDQF